MVSSLVVKGYFGNGKCRTAGIYNASSEAVPDIQQRINKYKIAFDDEIKCSPRTERNFPTFEYICVEYKARTATGAGIRNTIYMAVTDSALAKLTKEIGKPVCFENPGVLYAFVQSSNTKLMDLTKEDSSRVFWNKTCFFIDAVFKALFLKGLNM